MSGPMEGYKCLELTEGLAGPYAAMMLGDAGADVVKVESLEGDRSRAWSPQLESGESAVFWSLNRNKRSLALALERELAARALDALVRPVDVVLVDRARIPAGFTYDILHERHPSLVYCAISDWGPDGPWASRPGGELPAQLASEWALSLGRLGEPPVRLGADVANSHAAVYAVQAICAALLHRARSGQGQQIDVSLFGALMTMRTTMWVSQSDPDEWGGFHVDSYVKPPDHGYTCADGGRILIRLTGGDLSGRLASVIDELDMGWVRDDPLWPKFSRDTAGGTGRYTHELRPLWERGLAKWTSDEAIAIFRRNSILAVPLNDYPMLVASEQVKHLGIIAEHDGDRFVTSPWQFQETPAGIRRSPPRLGEHSRELLRQAGFGAEEVEQLIDSGDVRQVTSLSAASG